MRFPFHLSVHILHAFLLSKVIFASENVILDDIESGLVQQRRSFVMLPPTNYQQVSTQEDSDSDDDIPRAHVFQNQNYSTFLDEYRSVKISRTQFRQGDNVFYAIWMYSISLDFPVIFKILIYPLLIMIFCTGIQGFFGVKIVGGTQVSIGTCSFWTPIPTFEGIHYPDNQEISLGRWLSAPAMWISYLLVYLSKDVDVLCWLHLPFIQCEFIYFILFIAFTLFQGGCIPV